MAVFLPILRRHIELVAPKVLVCLGGSAAKALLATDTGILKLRGRWHDYDVGGGNILPLMPTMHPAYLLRAPHRKPWRGTIFASLPKKCEKKAFNFVNSW